MAASVSWKKAAFAAHRENIDMPANAIAEDEPWFRNPWVWLVIAIPSLTVIGCIITIYLALANPDHLVSDSAIERQSTAVRQR